MTASFRLRGAAWAALALPALCLGVCAHATAQAADEAARAVVVAARTVRPPAIDGRLVDEVWAQAEAAATFTQREPDEGQPATERTEVRVLYDEAALYVGVRLFDREPARIVRRLSSRDSSADADWVLIQLNPLHDHLTGFQFTVSAAGVQRDAVISNDTFTDGSWDAVWESAVSVDEAGWSAELRIPLSQLRFSRAERQTWGINVARFIHRKNETVWLEMVPSDESGVASRMGHLVDLVGLEPRARLELLPYTAARAEFIAPPPGDPFNDGLRGFGAAGLDLKWGLTGNLTLDGTINPDFGQVEIDPAVVNLTDVETFFPERRPFFIEGAQIFRNFGQGGTTNYVDTIGYSEPSLFHSRRIGRAPQLSPPGEFADGPIGATILGAVKLSGKTGNGWSLGLIEALTAREEARIETGGRRERALVEPRTNYFVARLQRDLTPRAAVGLLATGVIRELDTPSARDTLSRQAFVLGADGHVFLDGRRDWVVHGKLAASHLGGTPAAMLRAQRSSQRYYQRPDASHVALDPSRTSLGGMMGRVNLNRNGGNWQINAAVWGVSPGFDSNDLGFQSFGDRIGTHTLLFWRKTRPDRWTRFRYLAVGRLWTWNFGRQLQGDRWLVLGSAQFRNYWTADVTVFAHRDTYDDRLTRGGPVALGPGGRNWDLRLRTDARKRVALTLTGSLQSGNAGNRARAANGSVEFKPSTSLTISAGPSWSKSRNVAQYLQTVPDAAAASTYGNRYVFGVIDQRQLSMTTRVTYVVSPRMSIQLYTQPLLAVGDYGAFRELAGPGMFDFLEYGTGASMLAYDPDARRYFVDPDGEGAGQPFTFADPDFNFKSLRVNAVFRWEVRPGSNLYVVWTRRQQDLGHPGDFRLGRDAAALFKAPGDDVLLVKLTYWLGR